VVRAFDVSPQEGDCVSHPVYRCRRQRHRHQDVSSTGTGCMPSNPAARAGDDPATHARDGTGRP
jgi:hypothetical protein